VLHLEDDQKITIQKDVIGPPYAKMVRAGQVKYIDIFLGEDR
jgi:hypothetical protein